MTTRRAVYLADCAEQLVDAVRHLRCVGACLRDAVRDVVLAVRAGGEVVPPRRRAEDAQSWTWTSKGGDA